jgi:hypothetical protein
VAASELFRGCRVEKEVLGFDISMNKIPVSQELEGARELAEEAAHDNLVQTACSRVGVVLGCGAGGWDVFEAFDAASFLDIIREVPSCTVFHDQVDVGVRSLEGTLVNSCPLSRPWTPIQGTHHDVKEAGNVSV